MLKRLLLVAQGQVQGVGFRPFLWRLAKALSLSGHCRNTAAGVEIEIQGAETALAEFEKRLHQELPPLAKIVSCTRIELDPQPAEEEFVIGPSEGGGSQNILVSPDIAICENCLADIRDPENRRFNYPFTNCTDCGPRFSITRALPYDRANTTMACFPMCVECANEYRDPRDRRFHAQPVACGKCGPKIWYVEKGSTTLPASGNMRAAIAQAGAKILQGGIVAIRGLGGFQLACDATNERAVAELRTRKSRPHKALAVMSANLENARKLADINATQEELLTGIQKPIVLCPAMRDSQISAWIHSDTTNIGLMLPYTPLHALLLDWLAERGCVHLVMTSANRRGEPICLSNPEALRKLDGLADAWLLHDRDILCRIDDSVVAADKHGQIFYRRARGYVPEPVHLRDSGPAVLGCGAQLKASFCMTRDQDAFIGQHIGDLDNVSCADFYEAAYAHLENLLGVRPELIMHDLHPDFHSSQFAAAKATGLNVPAIALQHHAAHAAACLAENNVYEPCLALCLDGTGLGSDGAIWGGELLYISLGEPAWKRLGCLSPFILPGGEKAITQPWRIVTALRWQGGQRKFSEHEHQIAEMLAKGISCHPTTSAGRLFDAVAAMAGICEEITYEGQAAIRLETAAIGASAPRVLKPEWRLETKDSLEFLDSLRLFESAQRAMEQGASPGEIAYQFHANLAGGFAAMAAKCAARHGVRQVALTGGVFNNSLMRDLLVTEFGKYGLKPLLHRKTPPGDGCIGFGQAVWGRQLLIRKQL